MAPGKNWIRRSSECALAWSQPRWRLQLLPSPRTWVHATLPGIVPAAMVPAMIAMSTAVTQAVTTASAHLPPGHGA